MGKISAILILLCGCSTYDDQYTKGYEEGRREALVDVLEKSSDEGVEIDPVLELEVKRMLLDQHR